MSITIKRNTGWQGIGTQIQIKVNGEKMASVAEQQQIEVDLSEDKAHLTATQLGIKSNEIEVKDGDIVEIVPTKWYRMTFPLSIALMFFTIFIPTLTYRLITTLFLGGLLILSLFLIDGFQLKAER